MSDSFGEAVMTFTESGFTGIMGKLKQAGGAVNAFTSNAAKQMANLGNASKSVFGVITGSILGTVTVANQDVFGVYTGSLKLLGAVVGTIVMPVLRDLTVWTTQIAVWIAGLSDTTKSNIATFIQWAGVITGVAVAVNFLSSTFGGLISTVVKFVVGNPLLGLLALAAFAVYELAGGFEGLKEILSSAGEVFGSVFSMVGTLLSDIVSQFKGFFVTLNELFPSVGSVAVSAFKAIGDAISWVVDKISGFIGWIQKLIIAVGVIIKKASNLEFSGYGDDIEAAFDKYDKNVEKAKGDKKSMGIAPDDKVTNAVDNQLKNAAQSGFMGSNKGVSVSGISSSWSSVQSSFKTDPAIALGQATLDVNKQSQDILKGIKAGINQLGQTNRQVGHSGGGADF